MQILSQFGWQDLIYMLGLTAIYTVLGIHILLTKHEEPASALLWLLVLLIPVLGIVLYLIFGINRLKRMKLNIESSSGAVSEGKKTLRDDVLKQYYDQIARYRDSSRSGESGSFNAARALDRIFPEIIPVGGNRMELLQDGTMAYPRMLEDIKAANNSIHMQSFIIMKDPIAQEIFDTLAEKARQGVKVKVMYDRFGSAKAIWGHFFNRYVKDRLENLDIRPFAPINIFTPWRIQLRNHRKLLVIDGKTAYIGGINISEENTRSEKVPPRKYIHDLHCRITGPAVSEFQYLFLRDWVFASKSGFKQVFKTEYFPELRPEGDNVVRVVDSGPGQNYEASASVFFVAAATAASSLWIMTPYFVPEASFIKVLCLAAARGVDVRVIVPKNNNHFFVDWAAQSLYRRLLRSGVRIFEKKGIFSHAKAMIVDTKWCFMGSSNCDVRSFKLNYEMDFCVEKGSFSNDLYAQFCTELDDSEEVMLAAVENKKLLTQIVENLCALLTPIL